MKFLLLFLAIEFLDEFVFGAREAAWPMVRGDLGLTYAQVGILLSLPNIIGNAVEPFLGILGDVWRRRALVLGGGVIFALALGLAAVSQGFPSLLAAFIFLYPASGAFVSLSQATLMDMEPARHEQNMARWTFAGSMGVVLGPLALGGVVALRAGACGAWCSWRGLYLFFALLAIGLVTFTWRRGSRQTAEQEGKGARENGDAPLLLSGLRGVLAALRRRDVIRWLVLLEFSDLMLDVLLGYLALYFTDVVGVTEGQAAGAVAVWTGVGLAGDLLLIPLLERVRGLDYLRVSVVAELLLFPAFLLAPQAWLKVALLALLGLFNSGWYAILQARLYSALPGQSGTALAVKNVSGLAGALVPLGIGLAAQGMGLGTAMWLLLAGPAALLFGLPRRSAHA